MENFKKFYKLFETALSSKELLKYGNTRVEIFRKKIKDGAPFQTTDNQEVIIKNIQPNLELLDRIESGELTGGTISFEIQGGQIPLNRILKSVEFGGKGASKATGGDKTSLQEVGVLVALDILLSNKEFAKENLSEYKFSSRMNVSVDIESIKSFLLNDEGWFNACYISAETIIKKFGKKLSGYEFHHDSSLFNSIRETGKKLSGLNSDKWNPSDIYLVSKYPNLDVKDIIEFNNEIFPKEETIIGISLKKGDTSALHGSIALGVMAKKFGISIGAPGTIDKEGISEKTIQKIVKNIKSMPSAVKNISYVYLVEGTQSISESLKKVRPEELSENWKQSIPIITDFMSQLDPLKWDELLKQMIFSAMSVDVLSCSHYKVSGDHLSIIPLKQPSYEDITLQNIVFKFNGDTNLYINYNYLGDNKKAQMRSKGSLPQLIIIGTPLKELGVKLNSIKQD